MGEEALPDADRPHEQDVFAAVEKLQRAGGVEELAVEADLCRPVEVLKPAELLEAGLGRRSSKRPWSRWLTSPARTIYGKSA